MRAEVSRFFGFEDPESLETPRLGEGHETRSHKYNQAECSEKGYEEIQSQCKTHCRNYTPPLLNYPATPVESRAECVADCREAVYRAVGGGKPCGNQCSLPPDVETKIKANGLAACNSIV